MHWQPHHFITNDRSCCSALLDILEYRLSKVGVQRLIAQPREASLPMFTDSLGWEVVHPVDAAHLHNEIPIGFFDTVLVEKQLL